jgi:tetratricopeptide (TPR) repeat protein
MDRVPEALKHLERAKNQIDLVSPNDIDRWVMKRDLALAYQELGRSAEVIPLMLEVIPKWEKRYGRDDSQTMGAIRSLSLACVSEGRFADLAPYLDRVVADMRNYNAPPEQPRVITELNLSLLQARCLLAVNEFEKAEKPLRELQKMPTTIVPIDAWQSMLGAALLGQKKFAEAEDLLLKGYENLGAVDVDARKDRFWLLSDAGNAIVRLYEQWEKPDLAVKWRAQVAEVLAQPKWLEAQVRLFEHASTRREPDLGRDHLGTLAVMQNLAFYRARLGQLDEAERILVEVARRFRQRANAKKEAEEEYYVPRVIALNNLWTIAFENHHPDVGVKASLEYLEMSRPRYKPKDPEWAGELARVADRLLQFKQFAAAEPIASDCLRVREEVLGKNDWQTANAKSMLGGALLGLNKPDEAEPLLLKAYDGLLAEQAQIRPPFNLIRLGQAVDRLVQLYEATGMPDKAAEFREKRPPEFGPMPRVIK